MGTINKGILGGFSGKVGPVVGCKGKNGDYIRARAAQVSNPRTEKQQKQRGKFTIAFNFLKAITPFIRIGYKGCAEGKSTFNAAMSYMLKKAITGSGAETAIDFKRVLVSTGTLMPVFSGEAAVDGNQMIFHWEDNSGTGNAEKTDVAMLLVYNKVCETAVYDTTAATRADKQAALDLPEDWKKDELIPYLGFQSADEEYVSNSLCLQAK